MFHPMDPMGPIMHHFDERFRAIEEHLGIESSEYKKDNDLEELDLSAEVIEDLIEKQKNVEYNREWNSIVKDIKKNAENGTSIIIYFNIKKYKKELMEKLNKLGFNVKQRIPETPEEDAVSYIITIKKND